MKVLTQIKNWFSGSVIFEAEVEGDSQNVRLGVAVKLAFGARADLTGAVLMGDTKLIGGRPVLQIGPIGSRSDYLMAFITNKGLYLQTGCFLGDLAQFRAALAKTHNSDLHATEYSAALQLVFSHVELWTPKKDASAETAPLDVHKASA